MEHGPTQPQPAPNPFTLNPCPGCWVRPRLIEHYLSADLLAAYPTQAPTVYLVGCMSPTCPKPHATYPAESAAEAVTWWNNGNFVFGVKWPEPIPKGHIGITDGHTFPMSVAELIHELESVMRANTLDSRQERERLKELEDANRQAASKMMLDWAFRHEPKKNP